MNCPFYGYAMFRLGSMAGAFPFVLIPSHGNQCALVTDSHSPCILQTNGDPVEWSVCPRVSDVRITRDV
jgi:hypothetical protein